VDILSKFWWLTYSLTERDLAQRYRGTALGKIWPFLYAAMLLAVFTFVFSIVLKVRWNSEENSGSAFGALMIFAGLVPHLFLSEVLSRAPASVSSMPNFVKKIRFPLPVLPSVVVLSSMALLLVNIIILCGAILISGTSLDAKALLLPALLLPLALCGIGLSMFLASIGVFFRDLSQITPLLSQLLMFLAPVCYPAESVPPAFQRLLEWNPLTWFVNTLRALLLHGQVPELSSWLIQILAWSIFAIVGYAFFCRTQRMFADLL